MRTQPLSAQAAATTRPLRVIMVDDHAMIVEALANFLESVNDGGRPIQVVAQAGSLREAVQALSATQAHVVVADVNLPDGNGLNLVRQIRSKSATIGLVVLTMYDDDTTLFGALDAGASALVRKADGASSVLAAVRHAAESPTVFRAEGLSEALTRRESLPKLSPREMQVLELISKGHKVSDIAGDLFMSESTVKTHLGKVYSKLGAHNRASAIMAAVKLGLVQPDRGT